MRRLGSHWKDRPGTSHSPQNETETQLPDQEKLADEVEAELLQTRKQLAVSIRVAAHHTLLSIGDLGAAAATGLLADLAYAFAYLEGARRGVLPATSAPPKNGSSAAIPPSRPTSSPQPGPSLSPFGETTRANR